MENLLKSKTILVLGNKIIFSNLSKVLKYVKTFKSRFVYEKYIY